MFIVSYCIVSLSCRTKTTDENIKKNKIMQYSTTALSHTALSPKPEDLSPSSNRTQVYNASINLITKLHHD